MKTKILSVLLAMVLVLALFASCDNGGGGDSTGGGTTPGGTTPGGTTPSEPEVVIPEGAPTYNVTWDKTELKYALTNNSNSGELESGCEKYYSGTVTNAFEYIDDLVAARNAAAAKVTNVLPRWDYESACSGWGGNIATIAELCLANSTQNPDIYCNFVYDLTCAQLKGCFANLLDNTQSNYFRFNETDYNPVGDHYFDAEAGEGYFYDYMKSLTLSDDKMYVLASNYCTDLVRAFLVVPLNVELMSSIKTEDTWTEDMTEVADFYSLVWRTENPLESSEIDLSENNKYREGWTYQVLAHYAEAIYEDTNDDGSDCVLADRVGFAAGTTSGLVASGFLYTTSVKIIEKTEAGYLYPETNENFNQFATAITSLFRDSTGIVTIDRQTAIDAGLAAAGETDLIAIRNRFAANKMLFGGIIAVGSLEHSSYQNMRTTGDKLGFGILPVPLYRSTYVDENENVKAEDYLTLVHNIARAVAISKSTQKFSQCTAYLDYLSRMSQEIIDEYYDVRLSAAAGGLAGEYNTHMLTYIRNHVRDCFDKTFEDAVANKIGATVEDDAGKWHVILMKANFQYSDFSTAYESAAQTKQEKLNEVLVDWNGQN